MQPLYFESPYGKTLLSPYEWQKPICDALQQKLASFRIARQMGGSLLSLYHAFHICDPFITSVKQNVLIVSPNYQVANGKKDMARNICRNTGVPFYESQRVLEFENGSSIRFENGNNLSEISLRGMKFHSVFINDDTFISYSIYETVFYPFIMGESNFVSFGIGPNHPLDMVTTRGERYSFPYTCNPNAGQVAQSLKGVMAPDMWLREMLAE